MSRLGEWLRQLLRDPARVGEALRETHPADVAEALKRLSDPEARQVLEALGARGAEVMAYLPPERQRTLLQEVPPDLQIEILGGMSTDDAADLLGSLRPEEARTLLDRMAPAEAEDVRRLLRYRPQTAGGRMTPEFVAVHQDQTVEEALEHLRRAAPAAETVYYVYVVDSEGRLRGVVSLRDLIVARPESRIAAVMTTRVVSVQAEDDQETVARLFEKYGLLALPVVDRAGRLLGVVTVDDVLDVVEEEATEDAYRLTGLVEAVEVEPSPWRRALRRLPWLLALMGLEAVAARVVGHFEHTLQALVALAFFIPMLNDQAGNMGIQCAAIAVRAIATGEVDRRTYRAFVLREGLVGLLSALLSAGVAAAIGWVWWQDPRLSLALAATVFAVMNLAALLGSLVPLGLTLLRRDPAVASGPFITSLMDLVTVTVYFTVAVRLLRLGG
ncbi:MAG: magnesium transporter [Armatimonadota bacterium]|nr:magnesium transporter [Armatimonadota bacterium]MDR7443024.1 magnesium transporter [Armatimonadota bacterium]MDR7569372.1 magnesium transporter [Armatimonadota bacterium]MDR7614521.1 magnesium transporter [Armatimonadota bacterium]